MDRESAREQFDYHTKELGLEHTFSFDEAWDFVEYKQKQQWLKNPDEIFPSQYSKEQFREGIFNLQEQILANPDSKTPESDPDFNPVKHTFTGKQYIREIFNPAGQILVTKIHKVEHPFFLLDGDMSILSEEGEMRISAPYYGITPAGTKRVIYAHTNCVFVTVHPTESKDLDEIEKELIATDYNELEYS